MKRLRLLVGLFLLSFPTVLQTALAQIGNCEPAQAETYLSANNVRARILNNGGLFYRGEPHVYEVPKGGGVTPIFSAGLWIGGMIDGQLRMAATRYNRWEFWPGPVDEVLGGTDCSQFDRIYRVGLRDIRELDDHGILSPDIADWPWEFGAPVIDGDGSPDNYNLNGGDRPEVLGHENTFWIMNDVGNDHTSTETPPIGVEVHATAFAATSSTESVNNATLYKYRIFYKGTTPLEQAYLAFFVDADLGDAGDDYVGSDSTLSMGFVYNGNNNDAGYGSPPPALATQLVYGPLADGDGIDNDNDGTTDEQGERLRMTSFMYYNNGGGVTEDPQTGYDYYNYMQARWKDGQQATFGGNGRDFSTVPTNFVYPGNPPEFWSEVDGEGTGIPNPPGDRRFVVATGPFDMQPGETEEILISIVWSLGADSVDSVRKLKEDVAEVEAFINSGFEFPLDVQGPDSAPALSSPGQNAANQPTNLGFVWEGLEGYADYQLHLTRDPQWGSIERDVMPSALSFQFFDLDADTEYFWRVRAFNVGGYGPWSETRTFSTGDFFLEYPGLELINPWDPSSVAFIEVVGPGGSDPCSNPRYGCAEVGGVAIYGGSGLNSTDSFRMTTRGSGWTGQYIPRFAPNDFEIRFTDSGSYAYNTTSSGQLIWVPFEAWDIGPTGPFGTNNPADDVRLVPLVFSDGEGVCEWSYGEIEWGSGNGLTDRIRAYYPSTSYADFEALVGPTVDNSVDRCVEVSGFPDVAIDDLIDYARGRTFWNLVFEDATNNPAFTHPETGVVIRFLTKVGSQPIIASPVRGANVPGSFATLSWSPYADANAPARFELQVSLSSDFSDLLADEVIFNSFFRFDGIEIGVRYFWRVRQRTSVWSAGSEWSDWAWFIGGSGSTNPSEFVFATGLRVTDASGEIPLVFGMNPDASDGFDADLDQLAPPAPPVGVLDARLRSPVDDFLIDIRHGSANAVWSLITMRGSGNLSILWDPSTLPPYGGFRLTDSFGGIIVDLDMRTQDSFDPPNGVDQLQIVFTGVIPVDLDVAAGWNMLGAPVTTDDMHYQSLFPNALDDTFFEFSGSYTTPIPAEFVSGTGYWIRFESAETATLEGTSISSASRDLGEGWNIISPPNCAMLLGMVEDAGGILLPGTLFGYRHGYYRASVLEPGKGFWVRTHSAGSVTLDCAADGAGKAGPLVEDVLERFSSLTILDTDGFGQTLYFGGRLPSDTHPLAYSAPPVDPDAGWQATFVDGRYVAEKGTATILLTNPSFPLELRLIDDGAESPTVIHAVSATGQILKELSLSTGGLGIITNPETAALRLIEGGNELPSDYALEQNYPNPFNPVTTIRFAIPQTEDVTLEVYDILGRRVATLLKADPMKAGWHDIRFDAGAIASGVYLYRISAGSFRNIRHMVVLK